MNNTREQMLNLFQYIYGTASTYMAQAPGRAEIIGNHTDYNHGFALAAAISQSTTAAVSTRTDEAIKLFSESFDSVPQTFALKDIYKKNEHNWSNYVKAIVLEFIKRKPIKKGFNLLVKSTVPSSGGVSSSAALELAVSLSLSKLYNISMSIMDLALLCKTAENSSLVDSPCGFLDQSTSGLAKKGAILFLDFLPTRTMPISRFDYIPANMEEHGISFMIIVDKNVKRNLGTSGYPARRASCEKSLPILTKLMGRTIKSLRDVNVKEFEQCRQALDAIDITMRMRVEHVVYENERVLSSVDALKKGDMHLFGNLLSESGKSALKLYELDEKTPELTFLLHTACKQKGVIGARNMGGGFSANILVLIATRDIKTFQHLLSSLYKKEFNSDLQFIPFQPEEGAKIVYSAQSD